MVHSHTGRIIPKLSLLLITDHAIRVIMHFPSFLTLCDSADFWFDFVTTLPTNWTAGILRSRAYYCFVTSRLLVLELILHYNPTTFVVLHQRRINSAEEKCRKPIRLLRGLSIWVLWFQNWSKFLPKVTNTTFTIFYDSFQTRDYHLNSTARFRCRYRWEIHQSHDWETNYPEDCELRPTKEEADIAP